MKLKRNVALSIVVLTALSCTKTQFDDFEQIQGNADFSNYVAVGNSITQGMQDNGLHNDHGEQENSFPAILARQMVLNGANLDFKQPLVTGAGSGYMYLKYENNEITPVANTTYDVTTPIPFPIINGDPEGRGYDPSWLTWGLAEKNVKYNNLGVSAIRVVDCVPTEGVGVEYLSRLQNYWTNFINNYGRFLNWGLPPVLLSPIDFDVTYLDHIKASNATFFTCWLGNNDVLGWAVVGGDKDNPVGGLAIPGVSEIAPITLSDPAEFQEKYDKIMDAFLNMGAKGVCATIPDITSIPLFTTITLEEVGHDVWIVEGDDAMNPGLVRKATEDDLMLLTALAELEDDKGKTQANPLENRFVLDRDEAKLAQDRTIILNNIIRNSAATHGFPIADMYDYMQELESGLSFDGVDYTAKFIEGGAFSLDGTHPNSRGYAAVANKFIDVINETYGSTLRHTAVQNQNGILFP